MADAAMTPPSASSLRTDGDDGPGSRPNFTQRKEQFVKFVKEYECPDSSAPRRAFEATPQIQKYMVMLQEVVDRKRVSFEVSLDDMLAYLGDDDVVVLRHLLWAFAHPRRLGWGIAGRLGRAVE